jgi:AcrR family transcriptional regulator
MTTKEKILQAALELFTKQGFNKTSTAQISKQV